MLYLIKTYLGETWAPVAAVALFVVVVGVSLWLTPKLARWIDDRRNKSAGFYDDVMEHPPENKDEE